MSRRPPSLWLALALGLFAFSALFLGLRGGWPAFSADSYEYAQVARNVATGKGLTTNAVMVREMARLGSAELPAPYFIHDPGTSLVFALFFRLFGASNTVLAWAGGACFMVTIALVQRLGSWLDGEGTGFLAAFLAVTSTQLLGFSTAGLSEVPYACLLTLSFLLLARTESSGGWTLLASGASLGAAALIRSNSLPFLPWALLFIADSRVGTLTRARLVAARRRLAVDAGLFLAGFALVLAPNMARSYAHLGHPLHNIQSEVMLLYYTSALGEGKSSAVFATPDPLPPAVGYLLSHPRELLAKMEWQLVRAAGQVFGGGPVGGASSDGTFVLLLMLALFLPPRPEDPRARRLRWLLAACVVTAALVGAVYNLRWRQFYAFIPTAAVLVAARLMHELRRIPAGTPRAVRLAALLVLVGSLGVLPLLRRPLDGPTLNLDRLYRSLALFVRQNAPESAVVLVDCHPGIAQSALAWYSSASYVAYAPYTLQTLETARGDQPVYYLRIALWPKEEHPLEGGRPAGFVRVARWKDALSSSVALLLRREGVPKAEATPGSPSPPPADSARLE
jgi:4-amino-4-deoxy-L-arabinose transferase-like glycosyltransferase